MSGARGWHRIGSKQRGYILLAVVLALGVLAALSLSLNLGAGLDAARGGGQWRAERARYVAEAGAAHALARASAGTCSAYDLASTGFGADRYQVDFTPEQGSPVTLEALATLADGTQRRLRREAVRVYEPTKELTLQPGPAAAEDVYLYQAKSTWNYGTNDQLRVTGWSGSQTHSLLRFDLSALPPGVQILDARLEVHQVKFASGGGPVALHRVTADWLEGDANGAAGTGATWSSRNGTDAWTSAGGDFEATPRARTVMPSTSAATAGWQSFAVTELVDAWINGGLANRGLILLPETTATDVYLYSSDASDATQRPRLVLRFTCECGTTPTYDLELSPDASQGQDTYIGNRIGSDATKNFGDGQRLNVSVGTYNALLRFELPALPAQAYVTAAELSLLLEAYSQGASGDISAHRMTRDWLEGSGAADGATWETYDGIQPWTQVGGDFDPSPVATTTITAATGVRYGWDLTALVQGWYAGDHPNQGVLLRDVEGLIINALFGASDNLTATSRPRLTVTYTCPCGVICPPPGGTTGPYYLDQFNALTCDTPVDYSGSDGALDWSGQPWTEFGDDASSCGGGVSLVNELDSNRLLFSDAARGAERAADLSLFPAATLAVGARREELNVASRRLQIEVSADAGANWFVLGEIAGPAHDTAYQAYSYDISAFVSSDFRLRLSGLNLGRAQGKDRWVYVDNVQIAGASGTSCNSNYTPNFKLGEFDTATAGAALPRGALHLRPGRRTLGVEAPAGGAWLLVDRDAGLRLVDLDGTSLASQTLPAGDASGLTRVLHGARQNQLAVVYDSESRLDYLDPDGTAVGGWSTTGLGVAAPSGVTAIGATASGARDGQLALADRSDNSIVFADTDGTPQGTRDLSALGLGPLHDLAHLPGTDLLLLAHGTCGGAMVDFSGALLRQFDTCAFGVGQIEALAVNPLDCSQLAVDSAAPAALTLTRLDLGGGGGGEGGGGPEPVCAASFLDQFSAQSFANDDGTASWSTDWLEINEIDGPTAGDLVVIQDTGIGGTSPYQLQLADNDGGGEGVQREADLSGFAGAHLILRYRRDGLDDALDYVSVGVSADGGLNWTELDQLAGAASDTEYASAIYDLAGHLGANTRVRLLTSTDFGADDRVYFDDIQVCASY